VVFAHTAISPVAERLATQRPRRIHVVGRARRFKRAVVGLGGAGALGGDGESPVGPVARGRDAVATGERIGEL
jgi:hypothetical protein